MEELKKELLKLIREISNDDLDTFFLYSRQEEGEYKMVYYLNTQSKEHYIDSKIINDIAIQNKMKSIIEGYYLMYNNQESNDYMNYINRYNELNIIVKENSFSVIPKEIISWEHSFEKMKLIWDYKYLNITPRKKADIPMVLEYLNVQLKKEADEAKKSGVEIEEMIFVYEKPHIILKSKKIRTIEEIRRNTVRIPNKDGLFQFLRAGGIFGIGFGIKLFFRVPIYGYFSVIIGVVVLICSYVYSEITATH